MTPLSPARGAFTAVSPPRVTLAGSGPAPSPGAGPRVEVRGVRFGLVRLVTLPIVARGRVSAGVRVVTASDDRLESRLIADLGALRGGPCGLANDLR